MAVAFSTVLTQTNVVRPDGGWPEVEYVEPSPPRPAVAAPHQEAAKTSRRTEVSVNLPKESDDLGKVLHETKNLRSWLESRLDDVSRDLRRVHQKQQELLKSQEKVSRYMQKEQMSGELSDERELLQVPTQKRSGSPTVSQFNLNNQAMVVDSRCSVPPSPRDVPGTRSISVVQQLTSRVPTRGSDEPEDGNGEVDETLQEGAGKVVVSLDTGTRQPSTPPSTDLSPLVPRSFSADLDKRARPAYSQPLVPGQTGANLLEEREPHRSFPPYVVLPSSTFCLLWDLLGVICLSYDLVLLPVIVAWELPNDGVIWYGSWATVSFWTVDVALAFVKAVETEDKQVVYGLDSICMYLKTWFVLDASVLGSDWLSLALELQDSGSGATDFIKLFRILKLNRFVRLIRVVKMGRLDVLWDRVGRLIWSMGMLGKIRILLRVMRFLVPGMLINHWCACIWYVVGKSFAVGSDDGWLVLLDRPNPGVGATGAGRDSFLEYASALQWSVSHMFGGSPVVMATNSAEHIFTVVNMVLGAICGSILISLVATLMMDLQNATLARRKQLQEVRRFIHDNRVKPALASAILKQVRERTEGHKRQHLKDVPIFTALSTTLWRELAYHVFSAPLFRAGFLFVCDSINPYCIKDICGTVVREHSFTSHETVFTVGDNASYSYLFKTGNVVYFHQGVDGQIQTDSALKEGMWLAELALWLRWDYRGTAVAIRQSEMLSLCVAEFVDTFKAYSDMRPLVEAYSRTLSDCLQGVDLTDLPQEVVEEDTMLLLMPPDFRTMISRPVLEDLAVAENFPFTSVTSFLRKKKSPLDLQKEVEKGDCLLKMDPSGTVYRLVSVAVLQLRDSEGRELVHMGTYKESGAVLPGGEYPATKARAGEAPVDALQRLLEQDLPALANYVVHEGSEVRVKEGASGSYGMPTKYLRTVFRACLASSQSSISDLKEIEWKKTGMGGVRSQSTGSRVGAQTASAVTKLNSGGARRLLKMASALDFEPQVIESFDLDHVYPAYHLSPTGGMVFSFLTLQDLEGVQLNKQSLVPWLEDLYDGYFSEDHPESEWGRGAKWRQDDI